MLLFFSVPLISLFCSLIGQEPNLKKLLDKIGDEIIIVHQLLNKLESEIQYHEQTNISLKVILSSEKKRVKF